MNTLDSQQLDYENDFLEANPFADTPSKSTELNKSIIEQKEKEVSITQEAAVEEEPISREEEFRQEEEEIPTHQGEQVQSPISTVNQLEDLSLEPELETETDTQVK